MKIPVVALFLSAGLAACGAPEEPPAEPKPPQGRAETRSIRNTDAVGYSGSEIADKVDGALDASEERNKRLEQEAEPPPE